MFLRIMLLLGSHSFWVFLKLPVLSKAFLCLPYHTPTYEPQRLDAGPFQIRNILTLSVLVLRHDLL